ncbi:Acetyl-coenzyme A synthetase [Alternaria alternata]|nr:Acetyl-coenzyme A synthetase [Alternaria alternata]
MSEGDVKPPSAPVVAEAHQVDTFHVPKAFYDCGVIQAPELARMGGVTPRRRAFGRSIHRDRILTRHPANARTTASTRTRNRILRTLKSTRSCTRSPSPTQKPSGAD